MYHNIKPYFLQKPVPREPDPGLLPASEDGQSAQTGHDHSPYGIFGNQRHSGGHFECDRKWRGRDDEGARVLRWHECAR